MKDLIDILNSGGIAIIPTDTIYGIVGQALNKEVVQKIYEIKKRTPSKPFIILISDIEQLESFGLEKEKLSNTEKDLINNWPAKTSIIFHVESNNFEYLHRGTNSLAFRLPDKSELKKLIKQTGPLIAPSANPEGLEPATTIGEAENYFDTQIDYYLDGGEISSKPSKLLLFNNGKIKVLRD